MEKYRPNLETVLEVPHKNTTKLRNRMKSDTIPEVPRKNTTTKLWNRMKLSIESKRSVKKTTSMTSDGTTLASLLEVIGAPLTPATLSFNNDGHQPLGRAKYIVKQYVAAVGGEKALSSSDNLFATGYVKITMSNRASGSSKSISVGSGHGMPGLLWQKGELWCLDLMLSPVHKLVSTGSDGKAPLPWHYSHAYRVPPLPLGPLLQGLNPRITANLFSKSDWFADKSINKEDCFILELMVEPSKLSSSNNVETVRHTILGYFSQKTGLLVKLEDSRRLRLTALGKHSDWESTMESYFQDYRAIDGVNIAHRVSTCVSLREESSEGHSLRRKVKLVWELEDVGLDVKALSMEGFLPRGDLKTEEERCGMVTSNSGAKSTSRLVSPSMRFEASKIVPIDDSDEDLESCDISDQEGDFDNF
ncbi:hypothetical protein ACLB2K_052127 [Fragaria x ananassa]